MLYVPNLDYNFLAPIKLMNDMNCITVLTSSMCVFQALNSGKMIGSAKVCDELYHCEVEKSGNRQVSSSFNVSSQNNVMLWHHRLGHQTVFYLNKLFPNLFNKDPRCFKFGAQSLISRLQSLGNSNILQFLL